MENIVATILVFGNSKDVEKATDNNKQEPISSSPPNNDDDDFGDKHQRLPSTVFWIRYLRPSRAFLHSNRRLFPLQKTGIASRKDDFVCDVHPTLP